MANLRRRCDAFYLQILFGSVLFISLAGCFGHFRDQVLYDADGIIVGVNAEAAFRRPSSTVDSHPTPLTPQDIQQLLGALEVTGYSGTLVGLFVKPEPIPVFSQEELRVIGPQVAEALKLTGPNERVFFSISKPGAPYDRDRTAGSLVRRDGYLHIVLTDHYAFYKADTGGGEEKDPRDTKGMKLLVSRPAVAASLSKDLEPDWGPFETVHVSLRIQEVLAALNSAHPANQKASIPAAGEPPTKTPSEPEMKTPAFGQTDSNDVLRSQIKELSGSNQDLRSRLDQQTQELEQLREEMRQLQQGLKQPKPKRGQKIPPSKPTP